MTTATAVVALLLEAGTRTVGLRGADRVTDGSVPYATKVGGSG